MATTTFKIGDTIIHRIIEMECGFTPALEFLPKLTPAMLDESRPWMANPMALDPGDLLVLCFQAYIIRTGKHTIMVDTCVGNHKDRPTRPLWHMKSDSIFLDGLKEVGLTVADIDFVLCTHLHVDHVGWNTQLEDGRWVPTFPNARYIFSKTELDFWLSENERTLIPAIADSVVPIIEAKRADLVTSDHSLNDLIALIPTPGHTIDHYAVTLGKQGRDAVFTGDLIHTPLQAQWPDLAMRIDYDPAQSSATRWKFLERYCDTSTQCCFAHFPSPSRGYIRRAGSGFKCEYIIG